MKRINIQGLGAVAVAGLVLTACGGLGKMKKKVGELEFTVTPDPMEVHADSVNIKISTTIPPKYFGKKVYVDATPVVVSSNGENKYNFESAAYQGEKFAGNAEVVNYKEGGKLSYEGTIAYEDAMRVSTLTMHFHGKQGKKKEAEFDSESEIAKGMITTPLLVNDINDDKLILGADKFERVTNHSQDAQINYTINSATVNNKELKADDIKALEGFVEGGVANERITFKGIELKAYASPDGEETKNNDLSSNRAKSSEKAVAKILKKLKASEADSNGFFTQNPIGEDWEGFKAAMRASDIEDKELIIRVIQETSDPAKREQEIKNIAETYKVIKDDILPELRRSQISLSYERFWYTDEELVAISKSNPDSLNVEQLLKAASLFESLDDQLEVYKSAESIYATDWRGSNNVGLILLLQGDLAGAKAQFEKSNGIEDTPESRNNLGVVARMEGDRAKAKELFESAVASGKPEVNYNLGIIDIQNGNYDAAVSKMKDFNSLTRALAEILAGNPSNAIEVIEASEDNETAWAYYVKAIAGAEMDKSEVVINNLKAAISKDASLKEKAATDMVFYKYWDTEAFKAIAG